MPGRTWNLWLATDFTAGTHGPAVRSEHHDVDVWLFTTAMTGRERTEDGIRFRFRADPGLEDRVRDLAAREKACCAFFSFDITAHGDEVWLDASVVDDDLARWHQLG